MFVDTKLFHLRTILLTNKTVCTVSTKFMRSSIKTMHLIIILDFYYSFGDIPSVPAIILCYQVQLGLPCKERFYSQCSALAQKFVN